MSKLQSTREARVTRGDTRVWQPPAFIHNSRDVQYAIHEPILKCLAFQSILRAFKLVTGNVVDVLCWCFVPRYLDAFLRRVATDNVVYSPRRRSFVNKPGQSFRAEEYTDVNGESKFWSILFSETESKN